MTRYERIDFTFKRENEEKRYYSEIDNAHRGIMAEVDKILQFTFPTYKRKTNSTRRLSEKIRQRNEMIKRVMKEYNLRLGQASKYIKENSLWKA